MITTVEQRSRKRALLLACCCAALAMATSADPAHASSAADANAAAVLAPGAGFDGRHLTAVSRLQRRLLRLGYAPGPVDGLYGPLTAAAVRRIQAANGLAADGITGPRTRRALRAQAGAEPSRVKRVQRRLRSLGRRPGPVDGIFGPRTVRALRSFQQSHDLSGPANLNAATLARLDLAPARSDPSTPVEAPPVSDPPQTATPTPPEPTPTPEPAPANATTPPGTVTPDPVVTPAAVATVTPDVVTAPAPQVAAVQRSPQPSPFEQASASPVPTLQDTGGSTSLTLQIAIIVAVMVLIAAWPFRRPRDGTSREREEDPLKRPRLS